MLLDDPLDSESEDFQIYQQAVQDEYCLIDSAECRIVGENVEDSNVIATKILNLLEEKGLKSDKITEILQQGLSVTEGKNLLKIIQQGISLQDLINHLRRIRETMEVVNLSENTTSNSNFQIPVEKETAGSKSPSGQFSEVKNDSLPSDGCTVDQEVVKIGYKFF